MNSEEAWSEIAPRIAALVTPLFPDREKRFAHGTMPAREVLPALQQALDDLHSEGGGRLIVPSGEYPLHGPLTLRSNVNLQLCEGAVLRFSGEPTDFLPPVFQRWEGVEVYSHSPLITARGARNIGITGKGEIDGQGARKFALWRSLQVPDQERLRDMGRDGVPLEQRIFGQGTHLRPSLFQPIDCENVLLEGITLRDSPFWIIHPTYCRNVIIRGVCVESLRINNDGCDPDSCQNVLIEDCIFHTGDDGVAIKSGRDQDGWRIGRPTERILIRNCRFFSKINGLCIGSEMSGGVRQVFMENCRIAEAASALYLKSNADRGGFIEEVFMRNIEIDRATAAVVRLEPNYHSHRGGKTPARFRGIHLQDIRCGLADAYGLFLAGSPDCPVEAVCLENVTMGKARQPVHLRHAQVRCQNVSIGGLQMPKELPETPADQPLQSLEM
jgi:polygalacturonase